MGVSFLRSEVARLESAALFGGRPYPNGIEPFPATLPGQGFFPGGDGLWRDAASTALRLPSPNAFPLNGIMFLGNDFGTLAQFRRLKTHENPVTWRMLRQRLAIAGIPGKLGFFTNAYLGLRSDRAAIDDPIEDPDFSELCANFLKVQISHQSPKLIVVLGPRPTMLFDKAFGLPERPVGTTQKVACGGLVVTVVTVKHPYCDQFKREPLHSQTEGRTLQSAWADAADDFGGSVD